MKKLHALELSRNQSILRFDLILQHDWPIETLVDKTNNKHFTKTIFLRSNENRSNANTKHQGLEDLNWVQH